MAKKRDLNSYRGIVTIIVLIAVGLLIVYGMFGTNFKAGEDTFRITGLHGQTIPYTDIIDISLENSLPTITARTGGFSLAGKRLGNFMTTELGKVRLFLFNNNAPFIYIELEDNSIIILNTKDSETTRTLYDDMKSNGE